MSLRPLFRRLASLALGSGTLGTLFATTKCESIDSQKNDSPKEAETSHGDVGFDAKGFDPSRMDGTLYNRFRESIVMGALGVTARTYTKFFNTTTVSNALGYKDAVFKRKPVYQDRGLITVCNHVCAIDDPLVPASILSYSTFFQPSYIRFVFCATNRCYHKEWLGDMLSSARVLPIKRGAGIDQYGMRTAANRLRIGDWVHTFPEGTRSKDPNKMGSFKAGVGKLVWDGTTTDGLKAPAVLPIYHTGMEGVLAKDEKGKRGLRIGNKLHINVGEPLLLDDLVRKHKEKGTPEKEIYEDITNKIEEAMLKLQKETLEAQSKATNEIPKE